MNKLLTLLVATLVLVACKTDPAPYYGYSDTFAFDRPLSMDASITPETNSIKISAHLGEVEEHSRIDKLKIVTEENGAKEGVHYTLPEPFEFNFAPNSDKAQLSIELHPEKITSEINLTITIMELKSTGDFAFFMFYDTLRIQLIPELPQP